MVKRKGSRGLGRVEGARATAAQPARSLGRRRGRKPDPARRLLRPTIVLLREEHTMALLKAAAERVTRGEERTLDKSKVLRLLLDGWITEGAKPP